MPITDKLDAIEHRWLSALTTFIFVIKYRHGKSNVDLLSCIPSKDEVTEISHSALKAIGQNMEEDEPWTEAGAMSECVVDPLLLQDDQAGNFRHWQEVLRQDLVVTSTGHPGGQKRPVLL